MKADLQTASTIVLLILKLVFRFSAAADMTDVGRYLMLKFFLSALDYFEAQNRSLLSRSLRYLLFFIVGN